MATWYISPTGSDSTGNGSSALPWATISKAHTAASAGDTIICKSGTYGWVTQEFTKSLIIQGETGDPDDVIFTGLLQTWSTTAAVSITINYLKWLNCTTSERMFFINFSGSSVMLNSCIIDNFGIPASNSYQGLISVNDKNGTIALNKCLIKDIYFTAGTSTGVFVFRSNTLVTYNITNCTFVASSGLANFSTPLFSAPSGTALTNILNCSNNIFANFTGGTINYSNNGSKIGSTWNYNDAYNITSPPSGTGNITSDPLFVDAANGNFDLRPSSPCRWTGTLV